MNCQREQEGAQRISLVNTCSRLDRMLPEGRLHGTAVAPLGPATYFGIVELEKHSLAANAVESALEVEFDSNLPLSSRLFVGTISSCVDGLFGVKVNSAADWKGTQFRLSLSRRLLHRTTWRPTA